MRYFELFEAKGELLPGLDPEKYVIVGRPENWRAYTYSGYESKDPNNKTRAGDMGKVGYIMFSTKNDTFIPIARGDEHHRGYDLLYSFAKKKIPSLNPRDYIPIFNGNNYIYDAKDIPAYRMVIKKYLAMGGKDGVLYGGNELRRKSAYMSDFAETGELQGKSQGRINASAKKIIDGFKNAASAIMKAKQSNKRIDFVSALKLSLQAYQMISLHSFMYHDANNDFIKSFPTELKDIGKNSDVDNGISQLEQIMFGFHGLKNRLHNVMRDVQDKPTDYFSSEVIDFVGDIDLVVAELGNI